MRPARPACWPLECAWPPCVLTADGKMTWLIDFVGYNRANSPPLKVSLQVLSILQVGRRPGCWASAFGAQPHA